ncbi:hypothetical protein ELUCI_v1c03310 [Williamsoniiplasma lucivorax]|uniref:Uncharacterized protein n=2 Tax=Williamsoniiplasma lucivorax TaxID=209274 RepID=A0A2S5RFF1_9MOLU|nr:hypothetical protein ELUCI_v1c03310 [Williamsoniiplasma lucivorax]
MNYMPFKKFFKNISYRLFLEEWKLDSHKFSFASEVDKKNIILKNMHLLLRFHQFNDDDFITQMNIIRLLSAELYYASNSELDADTQLNLRERILDLINTLNLVVMNENLECKVIKEFDFSEEQIKKYFSYNKIYSMIASIFASPFIEEQHYYSYYEYAYYLAMYLNLHYFSNIENINPDINVFIVKLNTQFNMINAIQTIAPVDFNVFVLKTNKWINTIKYKKLNKENK